SALKTRRATIEERQYELESRPDPEQIRQDDMKRSLERSLHNPPLTDIWSGIALNDLLRAIQDAHTHAGGPDVPLSPEVTQHINLTPGVTSGGTGLLKNGGKLSWPHVLRKSPFDEDRKQINAQVQDAVKQA